MKRLQAGQIWLLAWVLAAGLVGRVCVAAEAPPDAFRKGIAAYEAKDFTDAVQWFSQAVSNAPTAGGWQNLGNAEWQAGRKAEAILAWERALLLNPRAAAVENNLRFARARAQLEAPDFTWCEIAANWMPATWWAWLAVGSFWFAIGMLLLPGIFRWKRSSVHQALVAVGLGVFLLTLPANYGVWTRSRIGVALNGETPLRLTPTAEGEAVTRLAAGEPGRVLRERRNYLLIQTRRAQGWVQRTEFDHVQRP